MKLSFFRLLPALLLLMIAAPAAAQQPVIASNAAPLASGEHQVIVNGVRLWYRVEGPEGAVPVVFLHGGPGQGSQTFAKFAGPPLERSTRMIYVDQRGSGRSEKHWAKKYSLDLMVDDLEQLRRHWGLERMAIIGHSFGTILGLEYAAKYPERVSHLILSGAVVDFPAAMDLHCERLRKVDPAAYAKAVAGVPQGSSRRCRISAAGRAFVDNAMYPDPAIMKLVDETDATDGMYNTGEIFGALAKQGMLEYRFQRRDRLKMPVLFISGVKDYQAVVEPIRSFVRQVPSARLIEYEGRGHFMFVEEPERFARDVTAFLKR